MSVRALLLDGVLKRVMGRQPAVGVDEQIALRHTAGAPAPAPVPGAVAKRFHVTETTIDDARVVTLSRRAGVTARAVVYLHGGGYAHPIASSHWTAIARFAEHARIDAVVPLYHVIPVGTATRAHEFVSTVMAATISTYGAGRVYVAGDSAGAGLALGVLQEKPEGVRGAVLLNPWLDVEIPHPAATAIERWDVILNISELRQWGRAWAAETSTADPIVSPLRGRFDHLPPVHLITGGRDLLLPDALEAHRALTHAGNGGALTYSPDGNHAVGLMGATTPEGKRALHAIITALQS